MLFLTCMQNCQIYNIELLFDVTSSFMMHFSPSFWVIWRVGRPVVACGLTCWRSAVTCDLTCLRLVITFVAAWSRFIGAWVSCDAEWSYDQSHWRRIGCRHCTSRRFYHSVWFSHNNRSCLLYSWLQGEPPFTMSWLHGEPTFIMSWLHGEPTLLRSAVLCYDSSLFLFLFCISGCGDCPIKT